MRENMSASRTTFCESPCIIQETTSKFGCFRLKKNLKTSPQVQREVCVWGLRKHQFVYGESVLTEQPRQQPQHQFVCLQLSSVQPFSLTMQESQQVAVYILQ